MIFRFLPLLLFPAFVSAAEQSKLDATEAMFTVMAAANAAGYDGGLGSSPEIRTKVREAVLAANPPVLRELKAWYYDNPVHDKTADLSRFISLGVSVGDPPDFAWTKRENDISPDVRDLDNFRVLLPRFYEQAHIEDLWQKLQPLVEETLAHYQEPIARTVLEANAYLRNPTYGFMGRQFSVLLDFLGAPNQVQTRSYGDDFFVVLTPSTDQHIFDIRHAYFRYLLDPLTIKYGMQLKEKESLLDIAEGAPLLREPYRSHFDLLASECLIKAVESRMLKNPALVNTALREGYILTPFFEEQLKLYEKQQDSMKIFFPMMIQTLNVRHEISRLEGVQFAKETVEPDKPKVVAPPEPVLSLSAKTVAEADEYYKKNDLAKAATLYQLALEQAGAPEDHSKAYFGMAHVALKQKDPEKADLLFHKTLESSPDADRRAWSYYYLGALSDAAEEREEAVKWYQQAIAVEGAPAGAVKSARTGLEKPPQAVK